MRAYARATCHPPPDRRRDPLVTHFGRTPILTKWPVKTHNFSAPAFQLTPLPCSARSLAPWVQVMADPKQPPTPAPHFPCSETAEPPSPSSRVGGYPRGGGVCIVRLREARPAGQRVGVDRRGKRTGDGASHSGDRARPRRGERRQRRRPLPGEHRLSGVRDPAPRDQRPHRPDASYRHVLRQIGCVRVFLWGEGRRAPVVISGHPDERDDAVEVG